MRYSPTWACSSRLSRCESLRKARANRPGERQVARVDGRGLDNLEVTCRRPVRQPSIRNFFLTAAERGHLWRHTKYGRQSWPR